jgi:putative ABC transport system substrate-binding protein
MQSTRTKITTSTINHQISTISWLLSFALLSITIFLLGQSNIAFAEDKKLITITEIVEHPSLEQAKRGIIDVLQENGYELGRNLEITHKNAQGAITNALLIAKQFVSLSPDAIVAISTPSAQAAIKAVSGTDIPLIFSSVTDPVAAGLVAKIDVPEANITGAIDYPLIDEEIELIQKLLPHAKTIGFLYSAGEANSVKTIDLMKKAVRGKFEYIDSQIANSNQLGQAITALVGRVDAIYIPSDNTVFSAMPKLIQMSRKHKIPVFSSDPDSVEQGVLACIGYTQYEVGRTAGQLLVRVLAGERNIAIQKPQIAQIFINKDSADIMGIEPPEELFGIKTNIVVK